jgi:hypothetical protein
MRVCGLIKRAPALTAAAAWPVGVAAARLVLLLMPFAIAPRPANAGVLYEVAVRPLDQSNLSLGAATVAAVVTQYFVDAGQVRVGGPTAKSVYLFKDQTMYVIDNTARAVHVLRHATLSQVAAHYADAVKQLEDAAATASADRRAAAEQKAADMKAVSDRLRQPVPRDYRVTVRFESVDGHACRIWEEREAGAKRLELCVAPTASVPGGAEMLGGMKTLSQFRQGSNFALGVDFGLSEWWPDIARLAGVPLLVREYKYDTVISEVMLSGMRQEPARPALSDLPDGYPLQDGPDYVQWYMR